MIPPRGFKSEVYPLRHRVIYSFGLGAKSDTANTALCTIVMQSNDIQNPVDQVVVNPHNTLYESDAGPHCAKMSIIDKMNISLKFNTTNFWSDLAHTSGLAGAEVFSGDSIHVLKFLWRPFFWSFSEKLDAIDDDTSTSVTEILAMTKGVSQEDYVPITDNKLPSAGPSEKDHPVSTVYGTQAYTDFNMTSDLKMEDHNFDEDLLQDALRRYTIKGALRACMGRTRHVTLSRSKPFHNVYLSKFVPRAIRRVMGYTYMGIQIHVPIESQIEQAYMGGNLTSAAPHLGVKLIANYNEWNADHFQDMTGDGT